ncbi:MAG: flagellar brake protein [Burkholderiales bacterium]
MRNSQSGELKFELMSAADDSRYHVHSRLEIASILRSVMTSNVLVTMFFDEGNSSIITALLEVDAENARLYFDRGPDEQHNRKLFQAKRLICVTTLDKIKIQFACFSPKPATHDKLDAILLPFPEKLLRLQRREYFRLAMPVINPPKCTLTLTGDKQDGGRQLGIADISCGGFSINSVPGTPLPDPLTRFDCVIELAETGTLRTLAELRNTFEVTLSNNRKVHRCGYQFVNLSEQERILLQRYIMLRQRSLKLRSGGML